MLQVFAAEWYQVIFVWSVRSSNCTIALKLYSKECNCPVQRNIRYYFSVVGVVNVLVYFSLVFANKHRSKSIAVLKIAGRTCDND